MGNKRSGWMVALAGGLSLAGCGLGGSEGPCLSQSDCDADAVCTGGMCRAPLSGDAEADATSWGRVTAATEPGTVMSGLVAGSLGVETDLDVTVPDVQVRSGGGQWNYDLYWRSAEGAPYRGGAFLTAPINATTLEPGAVAAPEEFLLMGCLWNADGTTEIDQVAPATEVSVENVPGQPEASVLQVIADLPGGQNNHLTVRINMVR